MKALTLYQPWASLVAKGLKTVETRSWATRHRGLLAIHASTNRRFVVDQLAFPATKDLQAELKEHEVIPVGGIVAACELVDVIRTNDLAAVGWAEHGGWHRNPDGRYSVSDSELPLGNFELGRYAWLLGDIRPIEPVAARGRQRLWDWEPAHRHGSALHDHAHGFVPHSHPVRMVCRFPECEEFPTHNIHEVPA